MRRKNPHSRPELPKGGVVRERITVGGIVQGVGFRPFVYRLAHELALTGRIVNTVHGVEIEAQGRLENVDRLVKSLKTHAPPMATVGNIRRKRINPADGKEFRIENSPAGEGRTVPVAPDSAVCGDCLAEMHDSSDRRWRYPFINCTNCGPRYTIIAGIPYDRPNTTMAAFTMCPACRQEYEDPLNRRFHAQPNACPVCGPRAWLAAPDGAEMGLPDGEDPLQVAGCLLRQGHVLAVKGLGGFHLACDDTSDQAVATLRARKRRQGKPFAMMLPDLSAVEQICKTNKLERDCLQSPARPIILLAKKKRPMVELAKKISPGMTRNAKNYWEDEEGRPWADDTTRHVPNTGVKVSNQEAKRRFEQLKTLNSSSLTKEEQRKVLNAENPIAPEILALRNKQRTALGWPLLDERGREQYA